MSFLGQRSGFIRRRYTGAQTVDAAGNRVRSSYVDTPFRAAKQSVSGRDRHAPREGSRTAELAKLFVSRDFLRTADQRAGIEADEVLCGSEVYVVTRVVYDGGLIPHQEVFITRRSEPT